MLIGDLTASPLCVCSIDAGQIPATQDNLMKDTK